MSSSAPAASPAPMADPTGGTPRYTGLGRRILPFVLALLFWGGCVAVVPISGSAGGMVPSRYHGLAVGLAASIALAILTAAFVRASRARLRAIGVLPDRFSLLRVAAGFLFGMLLVAVYAAIVTPIADLRWERNLDVGPAAVGLAVAGTLAGATGEELAFRGYPLRRLMAAYGLWAGQFLCAIAFILYHIFIAGWPVLAAIVGTGLGALLFGMAAVATRGLAVPIGVHAAWNFGMWALGTREQPAIWRIEQVDPGRVELANWIAFPVAAMAGIAFFTALHRYELRKLAGSAQSPGLRNL